LPLVASPGRGSTPSTWLPSPSSGASVVTISCVGPSVVVAYSGPSIIITNNGASFADPALNISHTISPYADFVRIRRGGDVDRISDR
jgi:hypothetical protein